MDAADVVNVAVLVGKSCKLDSRAEAKGQWGFVTEGIGRDVECSAQDREGTYGVRRATGA